MAVTNYSVTPSANTAINGINIAEGCAPGNINDAIRQLMADVRGFYNSASVLSLIASADRATARGNLGATATGGALFTAADAAAARATLGVRADTMATARLLGRTTAGSGAAEEITAGTGLTLATGTLAVSYVRPPDPTDDTDTATYLWSIADVLAATQGQGETTFSAQTATISGSSFDFTGIPSAAREIEVYFFDVGLNGSDDTLLQLIVSGSPVTTGYASASGNAGSQVTSTAGFIARRSLTSRKLSGITRLVRMASGRWVSSHSLSTLDAECSGGGHITGVGTVEGVRLTRTGSNSFDSGAAVVSWR